MQDTPVLKSGVKSSEFWVSIVALLPWLAQQFGFDPSMVADTARGTIEIVSKNTGSDLPLAIAGAYVVGRLVLKHFRRN
ncbi:MAG: hypothetical protein WC455_19500 [Dehalococcoidia bacterium]|jgi:hypothetical protein